MSVQAKKLVNKFTVLAIVVAVLMGALVGQALTPCRYISVPSVSPVPGLLAEASYIIFNDTGGTIGPPNLVYAVNGSTRALDYNGTSFSSVFNSVIGSNEKIVFVGNFTIDTPFASSADNVVLQGQGAGTVFTLAASFTGWPFTINGNGWLITQMSFDATNQVKDGSSGTVVFLGKNDVVSECSFINGDHGQISLSGTNDAAIDNHVTNSTDDGITIRGTQDVAAGNFINVTVGHNGMSLIGASNALVSGNTISYAGVYGIALENLYGTPNRDIIITGNIIWRSRSVGIDVYPPNGAIESADDATITGNSVSEAGYNSGGAPYAILVSSGNRIVIDSNVVNNCVYGIASMAAAGVVTITGNSVYNITGSASITTSSAYATISGNAVDLSANPNNYGVYSLGNYTTITGNQMVGVNGAGIGIRVSGSYTVVSGNTVIGGRGTARGFYTNGTYLTITGNTLLTNGASITLTAGSDYDHIYGNTWNSTVLLSGNHNIIQFNVGFVTENAGSQTNSTDTTFVINHGLAGTATGFWASFNDTGITGYSWVNTNATTITVTVQGTPAGNTLFCYWQAVYRP